MHYESCVSWDSSYGIMSTKNNEHTRKEKQKQIIETLRAHTELEIV